MIGTLPTPAVEMEHHRGFQTFAAMCGTARMIVTHADIARRGDGSQRR
jgi:hypothetical protein